MKTILLLGANGNIGFFLLNQLNQYYNITATSKSKKTNKQFFNLDLNNIESLKQFVNKNPVFDCLIFLVGLAHKKGNGKDIDEFREVNSKTLMNLLSALKKANKLPSKIIFSSTISVYGENLNQTIYSEESDLNPFTPYAISKLEAEEYLLKNFYNRTWILRLAPVYSPDFQLNINRRARIAFLNYTVGRGHNKLSLCNMDNISIVIQSIIQDKVPVGIYNISDRKTYNYNDLIRYLNAQWVIRFPSFLVKGFYFLGKMINNNFLIENASKLISDNIFSSRKIQQYIQIPKTLEDSKLR